MSYEQIINKTKDIETILNNLGAEGKGLHEKVSSLKNINKQVIKSIRFMATIRNNFLHDNNFKLTNDKLEEFNDAYEVASTMLQTPENYQSIPKEPLFKRPKVKKAVPDIYLMDDFEKNIIIKAKDGYIEYDNITLKEEEEICEDWFGITHNVITFGDYFCPNCEENVSTSPSKKKIMKHTYLVKSCFNCDYVFSSKKLY